MAKNEIIVNADSSGSLPRKKWEEPRIEYASIETLTEKPASNSEFATFSKNGS